MTNHETLLYPWFKGSEFEKYLTPEEKDTVDSLGNLTYQRQQTAGNQIREEHIGQLEAQIGCLKFQPLTDPDKFGLDTVLRKYGFIFRLKYPNCFYGGSDVSFYGCIVRDEVPFSKEHNDYFNETKFIDNQKSPLLYGEILLHERIGTEGKFWYLVDNSCDGKRHFGSMPLWMNNSGSERISDVSHFALLSKCHWKKMKDFLAREVCWD